MDEDARGHCRATPDFLEALRLEAAALTHTALHTVATLLSLWLQDPSEAAADADATGADGADTASVVPAVGQCRHCNVMGTAAMRCSGCRRVSYCDRCVTELCSHVTFALARTYRACAVTCSALRHTYVAFWRASQVLGVAL